MASSIFIVVALFLIAAGLSAVAKSIRILAITMARSSARAANVALYPNEMRAAEPHQRIWPYSADWKNEKNI